MFWPHVALIGMGMLAGIVIGCLLTRWAMRAERCRRCDEMASFDVIRYRCACGESIELEEL